MNNLNYNIQINWALPACCCCYLSSFFIFHCNWIYFNIYGASSINRLQQSIYYCRSSLSVRLFLSLLLDWTLFANFVEGVCKFPFGLISLLESLQKLSLFLLELFREILRLLSIQLLILDALLVVTLQILNVHGTHRIEKGFSTHLIRFNLLEFLLPLPQEIEVVVLDEVIDTDLLVLQVVVGTFI